MSTSHLTNAKTGTNEVNWIEATLLSVDRRRVFLAMDDALVRGLLLRCFEELGYDVVAAPNGRLLLGFMQGLPHPSVESGDVLLTDVEMPELDGFALVDQLRAEGWHLPVVFLSGEVSLDVMLGVQERNADNFFLKPFSLRELTEAVDELTA